MLRSSLKLWTKARPPVCLLVCPFRRYTTNQTADVTMFTNMGLDHKKAEEATRSVQLHKQLKQIAINTGVATSGCAREIGILLYTLATKLPTRVEASHVQLLSDWIVAKKLKSMPQLNAALDFIKQHDAPVIDEAALSSHCGVGVVVDTETIRKAIMETLNSDALKSIMMERKAQGLSPPLGIVLERVRAIPALRWADGAIVKQISERELTLTFASLPTPPKPDTSTGTTTTTPTPTTTTPPPPPIPKHLLPPAPTEVITFPPPHENKQSTPKLLELHLQATGGKVVTRFPPEPNGYLHIGHAKAMHLDFGYATSNGGVCYLRFDDTNPETEKQEYIDSIIENIKWLGYKVERVTYSSKYFHELFDLAVELIKRGKAYICHQTPTEIAESRNARPVQPSPYRDRPIDESLKLFQEMKNGLWKEGSATLRMKMDLSSPNPCMWDLVAYRIKKVPHPITGSEWCVSFI